MKKAACVVLTLTMAIFLISPLASEARGGRSGSGGGGHWGSGARGGYGGGHRGGYSGGHSGSHGGWWVPWAVFGGAAVMAPYFYSPYYEPSPVVIQEQPPVYIQPAPSVASSSTEKIFVYPRQGQSEELQAKDRSECHSWSVSQTQYDPTQPVAGDMPEARRNQMRADYRRAEDACLDGRGYTMK